MRVRTSVWRPSLLIGLIAAATVVATLAMTTFAGAATSDRVSGNLLQDPSFETVGPSGSFTQCTNNGGCGDSAASGWITFTNGGTLLTTDLVGTTLTNAGRHMIHVATNASLTGLVQAGIPGTTREHFSVWVFAVAGGVTVCVGPLGSPSGCAETTTDGQWVKLTGTYSGTAVGDEIVIYSLTGGNYAGYFDFYAENASVNSY